MDFTLYKINYCNKICKYTLSQFGKIGNVIVEKYDGMTSHENRMVSGFCIK